MSADNTVKTTAKPPKRRDDQWRVCFRWMAGNAEDVEIVDYH